MMTGYTETIKKWATDNRYVGIIDNADGTGEVGLESSKAGNRLAVRFTISISHDLVTDVRYQVFGCGFSMATCAVAADLALNTHLSDIHQIDARQIDNQLKGLPEERNYCADLAAQALQAAAQSARDGQTIAAEISTDSEHGPRVTTDHPIYVELIQSPKPEGITDEDRHLFACLISVASDESTNTANALGLHSDQFNNLLGTYFPSAHAHKCEQKLSPELNEDILSIILSYLDQASPIATYLAHILAARAAQPGHMWVAMGLFKRPELTAAIERHLPLLAAANNRGMRWKRYLYKQVCDLNGGIMCKAPNCGACSDYAVCFE